jgi:hypothetical protein
MDITASTASRVKFSRDGRGYDVDAVEAFRSSVVDALARYEADMAAATEQLARLEAERPDSQSRRLQRTRDLVESYELLFTGAASVAAAREERRMNVALQAMEASDQITSIKIAQQSADAEREGEAADIVDHARRVAARTRELAEDDAKAKAVAARTVLADAQRIADEQHAASAEMRNATVMAEQRLASLVRHITQELSTLERILTVRSTGTAASDPEGRPDASAMEAGDPYAPGGAYADPFNITVDLADAPDTGSEGFYERRLSGLRRRIEAAEASDS